MEKARYIVWFVTPPSVSGSTWDVPNVNDITFSISSEKVGDSRIKAMEMALDYLVKVGRITVLGRNKIEGYTRVKKEVEL